jgi:hypothetical protein
MTPYFIANPPCGIYKGDLPLGYAYYQTLLDVHARFVKGTGREVICPKFSLNALGKRAENLKVNGLEGLTDYAKTWIEQNKLRDRMNFSFSGNLLDSEPKSLDEALRVFKELNEKKYLLRKGDTFYLDIVKIHNNFDVNGILDNIGFFPPRAETEFRRIISTGRNPVRVTKGREFSLPNPFGGEEISPIFVVSNLWKGHFSQTPDLMAASDKELTRYLALRFYSQIPVSEELPMGNILVYNYITPEEGPQEWEISKIVQNGVDSDSARYAFAKSFSLNEQKTKLDKALLHSGKKLVYLVGNIKNCFVREGITWPDSSSGYDSQYVSNMGKFKYSHVLSGLEVSFREISKAINESKASDSLETNKGKLVAKYASQVMQLAPFCPFISDKVVANLKGEKSHD